MAVHWVFGLGGKNAISAKIREQGENHHILRNSAEFRVFSDLGPQKGPQIVAFIKGFSIGAKRTGFSPKREAFRYFRTFLVILGENRTFCGKVQKSHFSRPCRFENFAQNRKYF